MRFPGVCANEPKERSGRVIILNRSVGVDHSQSNKEWQTVKNIKNCLSMTLALGLCAALPIQVTAQETEAMTNLRMQMDIRVLDDVLVSCESDMKKFCSTVTPGEGRVLMCVLAYEDKISQRCGTAVFDTLVELGDTINNMQFAVEACGGDIEKTCGNVEPGGGRIAQCLIDNIATISEPCQKSVARFH